MQPDVMLAQADALKGFADEWEREATVRYPHASGYAEVAYLQRRAAALIARIATGEDIPDPEPPPQPVEVDTLRDG